MKYRGIGDEIKEKIFALRHVNKLSYKKISAILFDEGIKFEYKDKNFRNFHSGSTHAFICRMRK